MLVELTLHLQLFRYCSATSACTCTFHACREQQRLKEQVEALNGAASKVDGGWAARLAEAEAAAQASLREAVAERDALKAMHVRPHSRAPPPSYARGCRTEPGRTHDRPCVHGSTSTRAQRCKEACRHEYPHAGVCPQEREVVALRAAHDAELQDIDEWCRGEIDAVSGAGGGPSGLGEPPHWQRQGRHT